MLACTVMVATSMYVFGVLDHVHLRSKRVVRPSIVETAPERNGKQYVLVESQEQLEAVIDSRDFTVEWGLSPAEPYYVDVTEAVSGRTRGKLSLPHDGAVSVGAFYKREFSVPFAFSAVPCRDYGVAQWMRNHQAREYQEERKK